jgi:hypothetical protein
VETTEGGDPNMALWGGDAFQQRRKVAVSFTGYKELQTIDFHKRLTRGKNLHA